MNSFGRPAVFLDRDGVLNHAIVRGGIPHPPSGLEELELFSDACEALFILQQAGFILVGVTNQPDVARGVQRREVVEAINSALVCRLPLHEIFTCFHDDADECDCRKPRPGLLLQAKALYQIVLGNSFIIGDRWKDIEAGQRAGCRTVFIDRAYGPGERECFPDFVTTSLLAAAEWIVSLTAVCFDVDVEGSL